MRTTVRLDGELLAAAKTLAARQRRTLTSVLDEALRRFLADSSTRVRPSAPLPVSRQAGWVLPGVDIDDSASLLGVMDGQDGWGRQGASP